MDLITLAMAKGYCDRKGSIETREREVLSLRTVTLEETPGIGGYSLGATIELDQPIAYGNYYVYINGTKYTMIVSRYGDDRYDDGKLYMYLSRSNLAIIFYENAPETITVSVTQRYIPDYYMPGNLYQPDRVSLAAYDIENAIVELFSQGGGTTTLDDVRGFWGDIDLDRNLFFLMAYQNAFLLISGITLFTDNENVFGAAFSFLANTGENIYSVAVSIARSGDGAVIAVKVT